MYRIPDELVTSIRFVRALTPYAIGDIVSGDEYRTWPEANRRGIVDQGYVELIGGQPAEGARALERGDLVRVVVPRSDHLFDVVEGRKINDYALTDEAASALADEMPLEPPQEAERADKWTGAYIERDDQVVQEDPEAGIVVTATTGEPVDLEITNSGRFGGGNYLDQEAERAPQKRGRPKGSKNKTKPKPKPEAVRKKAPGESGEVPAAAE